MHRTSRPWFLALGVVCMTLLTLNTLALDAGSGADDTVTPEGTTVRVLLVGDSWAEFMWQGSSLRDVFAANGRGDLIEEGGETAISGSTAAEWTDPAMLQLISDELAAFPTIDTVQLSLGGNDFLAGQPGGGWWTGLSMAQEEALFDQIIADAAVVIDFILGLDPDLEIIVSLYDYTNFVDSLDGGLGFVCLPAWNDLGQPTPLQINEAGGRLQDRVDTLIASRQRVFGTRHYGLMQFTYGFPDEGIEPGDILPPGDLTRPSPIEAMFLGADCFHLSSDGYFVLAQNLWNNYYDLRFNGTLFRNGFELGDLSGWTASVP